MDRLIQHTGRVQAIAGGRAQIAVATTACSSCGQARGCGIGKLAGKQRESLVTVPASGLRVGQQVNLSLDESQLTRAAVLGYLLPAVLLLLGALAGEKVGADETAAALGALVGLCLGLLLTRLRPPLIPRLTLEPHHV